MKRLIIPSIILAGLAAFCLGQYRSRVSPLKIVQLSEPSLKGKVSFEEALANRRSVRQFTSQQVRLAQVSQLAWAGQGITEPTKGFRTAPSAGSIYPIMLYFATPEGVFVYNPVEHSLEQTLAPDVRSRLAASASMQDAVVQASCDIIVAGSVRKLATQFRERARTYMLLEAGHIAQNIQLQAVCLGLGSVVVGGFDIVGVGRTCRLPQDLEPLLIICVGYPTTTTTTETDSEQRDARDVESARAKRAVLIIARENFRDEELFETARVLTEAGVKTDIASTKTGAMRGALGGIAEAKIMLRELMVDDYDAIIFIGGPGATQYFHSRLAWNIAREAVNKRKILAAICIAPAVLANAGVLNGVRVTSFPSERDRLQRAGAKYTGSAVERDGLIITGNGPTAARQFGSTIADALSGR